MKHGTDVRPYFAALVITLLTACGTSPTVVDDSPANDDDENSGTLLVRDTFDRTTTSGWGRPDVGPFWFVSGHDLNEFKVESGRGLIVKPDNGPRNVIARSGKGTEGYGMNVTGVASFQIETSPDQVDRFNTVEVYARRDDRITDGDNFYRYRVRAFGHGRMDVRLEKRANGSSSWLSDNTVITTVWEAGQKYWIRWEARGTSPETAVRMRVWKDGATEPSSWHLAQAVDEPLLDVIGTTGFRVEGPSGGEQTSFPVVFALGDLEYREID